MIRNMKVFGLALVAVLAMGALAASGAQALGAVTGTGKTWLTFDAKTQVIETEGGAKVECTAVGGHATVEPFDTAITATAIRYTGCTAKVGSSTLPATISMTGCDYRLTEGETETSEHVINGKVSLICPEGLTGPIASIYASAAKHTANEPLCTLTMSAFTDHGNVTYTNTPETSGGIPNDFDLKFENVQIPVTRDGSLLCGSPKTAKYNGEITVTGWEDEGTDKNGNPIEGARTGVTIS